MAETIVFKMSGSCMNCSQRLDIEFEEKSKGSKILSCPKCKWAFDFQDFDLTVKTYIDQERIDSITKHIELNK